jgi:hypothetical protein
VRELRRLPLVLQALLVAPLFQAFSPLPNARAEQDAPQSAPPRGVRHEFGIVPLVGGDTDVGIGVGELSTLAALAPGVSPYLWKIESAAFISFAPDRGPGGSFSLPYQDYFIEGILPGLLGGRLRLRVRPSYTKETTQRYYGLGNASPAQAQDVPDRDFYGRTHPTLWVHARYELLARLFLELGTSYTQNFFDVPPTGTLAAEMRAGSPAVRALLGEAKTHGVLLAEAGLHLDTRDNDVSPERGQFHQIKVRVSPRGGGWAPYGYQQVNFTTRGYFTVVPQRLIVASRLVLDVQTGHPPFYELARYEDTFALGGVNGIRGVPGQRYYGKVKVFANGELRSQLVSFDLWGKRLALGAAGFFDVGRLWADLAPHPELDGTGWGLKYGAGGGLRLQQGKTFIVRADLAWSPDARPIGVYVAAGQLF